MCLTDEGDFYSLSQSLTLGGEDTDLPERHLCCTSNSFFTSRSETLQEIPTGYICLSFSPLLLMLRLSLPPSLSVCLQGTRDKNHQCGWRKCRGCEETAGRGGCLQGWLDELKGKEVGQTLSSALSSTDHFFAALLEISCFSTESGTFPAVIRGSIWSFATEKQCQRYANKAVFVLLWTSFETPAGSAKVRDCFWLWTLLIERSG